MDTPTDDWMKSSPIAHKIDHILHTVVQSKNWTFLGRTKSVLSSLCLYHCTCPIWLLNSLIATRVISACQKF